MLCLQSAEDERTPNRARGRHHAQVTPDVSLLKLRVVNVRPDFPPSLKGLLMSCRNSPLCLLATAGRSDHQTAGITMACDMESLKRDLSAIDGRTSAVIGFNVVSSIAIILTNKAVFDLIDYKFGTARKITSDSTTDHFFFQSAQPQR